MTKRETTSRAKLPFGPAWQLYRDPRRDKFCITWRDVKIDGREDVETRIVVMNETR
jgi:hypothetical protein